MHLPPPDDPSSESSGSKIPLAELVARARDKDPQAFEILYEHYQQPIGKYLMGLVSDVEVTRDLYQDTFVNIWNAFSGVGFLPLDVIDNFKPWLYTVARNIAFDHLRRSKKFEFLPLPQGEPEGAIEYALAAQLSEAGHEDEVCDRLRLAEALEAMSPQYRICYVLRNIGGLKHREIAKLLNISEKTVSSNIKGAYKQLRSILLYGAKTKKGGRGHYGKDNPPTL